MVSFYLFLLPGGVDNSIYWLVVGFFFLNREEKKIHLLMQVGITYTDG